MYVLLSKIGLIGIGAILLVLIVGLVFLFKAILNNASSKIMASDEKIDSLSKKHHAVDVNKYSFLILLVALTLSTGTMYTLFEFPDFGDQTLVDLGTLDVDPEDQIEIPPTEQKPPPPPKVTIPEIVEVKNEEKVEEEVKEIFKEYEETAVVEEVVEEVVEVVEEKEDFDKIFQIVEQSAQPKGGMQAFYKFVGKNINYPRQAKRMGIDGKVFLSFVVGKDGSLTDIKVVRGIGGGCDEEAVRVLKEAPNWTPGKQRGRAVRQKMTLPITFKLN